MTTKIKSRVPLDVKDEDDMRVFLDTLDRKHIKTGNLTDLDGAASSTDIIDKINELLAIYREQ